MPRPEILQMMFSALGGGPHPLLPVAEVLRGALHRAARVVYDDDSVRERRRQVSQLLHVLPLRGDAGDQIVLRHQRVAPVKVGLDQVVAVREVADSLHVRELAVALQHSLDARIAQVGICDDRVREAGPVGRLLEPTPSP